MQAITYACAVRTGAEFDVAQELAELSDWAICPTTVRPITPPGTRNVFATERPLWGGYVFARMDGTAFFESRKIKGLHSTKLALHPFEVKQLERSLKVIDEKNERIRREIEAGTTVTELRFGDQVEILAGPFAGRLANFAKVIRRGGGGYDLEVNVGNMLLPVTIGAADVRRAS